MNRARERKKTWSPPSLEIMHVEGDTLGGPVTGAPIVKGTTNTPETNAYDLFSATS